MESDKRPLLKLIDKISFFNDFLESEKCELIDKKVLVKKYEKKVLQFLGRETKVAC